MNADQECTHTHMSKLPACSRVPLPLCASTLCAVCLCPNFQPHIQIYAWQPAGEIRPSGLRRFCDKWSEELLLLLLQLLRSMLLLLLQL